MAYYQTIEADISAHTYPDPVLVKQRDSGRVIIIYPTSDGEPWPIPEGATVSVRILNPVFQSTEIDAEITEHEGRQAIAVKLSALALAEAGRCAADATISVNGEVVSTLTFSLDIEPAPLSDIPIPTPGGGVTREELDVALRQNSAVDQAFASASAQAVADSTAERLALTSSTAPESFSWTMMVVHKPTLCCIPGCSSTVCRTASQSLPAMFRQATDSQPGHSSRRCRPAIW